ncbi:MAG: isopentenyl-diphosphate delta-isomerase [Gammaproteobacteria bacterium]|jgi:isopentenyl-diphosphate delta-isomerase type 1|nr:isopentenyl-diphosphate delta-isomerase [Gammaproteobacteria bacterium]
MEHVILVNEQDQIIGLEEKLKAHQLGLLHRAFSVFLFHKDKILMQQRHLQKYHCGGLWTNTCCSHPREHENTLEAANRRLFEELGIKTELTEVGHFIYRAELSNGLIEHEFDHVFIGYYHGNISGFNQDEIAELQWISIQTLQKELLLSPEKYTPWLKQALDIALASNLRNA